MDKEKLILQIMKEAEEDGEPVSREEAEEMVEMEIKAKGIKNYTQSKPTKKKSAPKPRKVDNDKAFVLEYLRKGLVLLPNFNSTEIKVENEVKLHFKYNGAEYSVTLTKHRPPKK